MAANDWYPRYGSRYSRKTSHLTLVEHGAYSVMLDWYYDNSQPLPANAMQVHRICRAFAPDEQAAVQSVLDQFFELREDGWHNLRADEELEKRGKLSEKRKSAAEARWGSMDASASANGYANASTPTPNTKEGVYTKTPNTLTDSCAKKNVDNLVKSVGKLPRGVEINKDILVSGVYSITDHLDSFDLASCKALAESLGWDFTELAKTYNAGVNSKRRNPPDKPEKAFPAWVRRYTKGKPPS